MVLACTMFDRTEYKRYHFCGSLDATLSHIIFSGVDNSMLFILSACYVLLSQIYEALNHVTRVMTVRYMETFPHHVTSFSLFGNPFSFFENKFSGVVFPDGQIIAFQILLRVTLR